MFIHLKWHLPPNPVMTARPKEIILGSARLCKYLERNPDKNQVERYEGILARQSSVFYVEYLLSIAVPWTLRWSDLNSHPCSMGQEAICLM